MKQHRVAKNNSQAESIAFSQSIGARMSAMEHLIPEQMFSTATDKAQGISAVKALALASQQGQKIWTINQNNLDLALDRINLGEEAEMDIRNAVNAGKIATAHEARLNFNGWIGEGYTLIDPETGAGAYMIAGGGNGGELLGGFLTYFGPFLLIFALGLSLTGISTLVFLGFLLGLVLEIDSLIYFLWNADVTKCKPVAGGLFSAPILLALLSGFAERVPAIKIFMAGFIIDGAIAGVCL